MNEPTDAAASSRAVLVEVEPSNPKTMRERLTGAAFAAFGFGTMYFLLSGPMAFLHKRVAVGPFRSAIEILYAPIVFIVKNDIEPLATMLKAYVGLFT